MHSVARGSFYKADAAPFTNPSPFLTWTLTPFPIRTLTNFLHTSSHLDPHVLFPPDLHASSDLMHLQISSTCTPHPQLDPHTHPHLDPQASSTCTPLPHLDHHAPSPCGPSQPSTPGPSRPGPYLDPHSLVSTRIVYGSPHPTRWRPSPGPSTPSPPSPPRSTPRPLLSPHLELTRQPRPGLLPEVTRRVPACGSPAPGR